ncbi:MAG TPA: hypothetical protein P5572_21220 [Phycisphaerae bacterium]|nr:hypothetical protein [Phycisphaerae bacterium]
MRAWLHRYKPSASRVTHLLLAGLMWSAVGTILCIAGGRWLYLAWGFSGAFALLVAGAVAGGLAKARFALAPAANRIAERIRVRGDGNCLGGFLSLRTWGLVVLMSVTGRVLRALPIPRTILGFLYTLIGVALVVASRRLWRARRYAAGTVRAAELARDV